MGDFTLLRDDTQLPLYSTLVDGIERQKALEELTEQKAAEAENTSMKCLHPHQTNFGVAFKVETNDRKIPTSFEGGRKWKD